MSLQLRLADRPEEPARYFTWAPARCVLQNGDGDGATVRVSQRAAARGGRLLFATDGVAPADSLTVHLPATGAGVALQVSGEFERPSRSDGDVEIVVSDEAGEELAAFPAMVRVRKDVEALEPDERERFLRAFAVLNDQGRGPFQSFRDCHTDATQAEAHGNAAFLPWHRAFLLDLERELQRLDPSVTLPYWRFDVVARRLFRADFIGATDRASETARLAPGNPLITWTTDGTPGIIRVPLFNTQADPAPDVLGEAPVVGFDGPFAEIPGLDPPFEINPHGYAHVAFTGSISDIDTAAKDPLFFLLHCNVDRLWAKWQWLQQRSNPDDPDAFGGRAPEGRRRPGHNLADSMWPWNGQTGGTRPAVAPRASFPETPPVVAPGASPTVRSMIDYQGVHTPASRLGFDYDDVPYQP